VVVGAPYTVGDTLYTPVDTLNYDEVGYSIIDGEGGEAVTAAHHTLPLPSYVEVTSLTTGRTILVRVERRGPMHDNSLIALSPGAAEQLGSDANAPVRVRRVNPPEQERAALRLGGRAPERLETPETLLAVLRRKLPQEGSASLASATPAFADLVAAVENLQTPAPVETPVAAPYPASSPVEPPAPVLAEPAPAASGATVAEQAPKPAPPPKASAPATAKGNFVVQAATFSTAERAQNVAKALGGSVSTSGKFFRVRTGPFTSRAQAEASLAKVRAAGYSDARILTNS